MIMLYSNNNVTVTRRGEAFRLLFCVATHMRITYNLYYYYNTRKM